ncbi:MAG: hypothetical protein WC565_10790 [Parcubacteria group bacterium]|jgi:hypothetical protein
MSDQDSADLTSDYINELREEIATLRARAELAEKQRDYWISEADKHGHGPSGDELPFGEEVADDPS